MPGGLVLLLVFFMAYRLRREQSDAELLAAFIVYAHLPPGLGLTERKGVMWTDTRF